jgi:hypothetical protein
MVGLVPLNLMFFAIKVIVCPAGGKAIVVVVDVLDLLVVRMIVEVEVEVVAVGYDGSLRDSIYNAPVIATKTTITTKTT